MKPFSNAGQIGVELTQLGQWVSRVNMDIVDMAFIKVDKEESFQLSNYTKRAKINEEQLQLLLMDRCLNITRINLTSRDGIGYPTAASAPHSIANGLKNLMAIAAETDIPFPDAEKLKAYFQDIFIFC